LGQAQGGVASEDMYQMLSYGLAKQCQDITLLYPTAYGTEPFLSEDFEVKGGFLEDKSISVRAVDLDITQKASSEWKVNLEQLLITQFEKIIF
jgi:5-methylcytosine-specific restriction endonuclease McrBC regulatory subunit McrC